MEMDQPTQLIRAEHIACSFKPVLQPQYDTLKAECDPWILTLLPATTSAAAAQYCIDCLFPLFSCLVYPECAADRVSHLVKLVAWWFLSDTEDDQPSLLGWETRMAIAGRRHQLLIALYAGRLAPTQFEADDPRATQGLAALQEVWKHISKDMPTGMQARFLDAMRDYLNAVRIQAHYREASHLPNDIEEYIILRRPASLVMPCLILVEYGLGIELDEEAVHSELMLKLHNAVIDHIALANDVLSCEAEVFCGDYINLPSIIHRGGGAGMTFEDAMQQSLRTIEEVDGLCVQLMAEVEKCSLIHKPGMRAYLRGLGFWLGGNLEWSLRTARYTHVCDPTQQQDVLAVQPI